MAVTQLRFIQKENGKKEKEYLYHEGRVNFVARADYSENSEISKKIIKLIVDQVNIAEQIEKRSCCN